MYIVPANRLLLCFGFTMLPLAVLAGTVPEARPVVVILVALLIAVMAADAGLSRGLLGGVSVSLPATVRLSLDREGSLDVEIRNAGNRVRSIRLGLAWPEGLVSPDESLAVSLPTATEESRVTVACRAHRRGRHLLPSCHLETESRLGFWQVRRGYPCRTEIRVYPNLQKERSGLAALFLNRGGVGIHSQRQVGRGRDFERLREYAPGDSFDEVYWKATARRGKPITKVFQLERTQEVYVIIDKSRLSARPGTSHGESLLERFITAALVMGLAAERQGDLFGLITFSDRVEQFVRARNGKAHYGVCRDALYTVEPSLVTPDFSELFTHIRTHLRRRALLIFLTSLDNPVLADAFRQDVALVARHHLLLVNMVRPPDVAPLFTGPDATTNRDIHEQLSGHLRWHDLKELGRDLHADGVNFSLLDNEKLCVDLVNQYMSVKQRQLL